MTWKALTVRWNCFIIILKTQRSKRHAAIYNLDLLPLTDKPSRIKKTKQKQQQQKRGRRIKWLKTSRTDVTWTKASDPTWRQTREIRSATSPQRRLAPYSLPCAWPPSQKTEFSEDHTISASTELRRLRAKEAASESVLGFSHHQFATVGI